MLFVPVPLSITPTPHTQARTAAIKRGVMVKGGATPGARIELALKRGHTVIGLATVRAEDAASIDRQIPLNGAGKKLLRRRTGTTRVRLIARQDIVTRTAWIRLK